MADAIKIYIMQLALAGLAASAAFAAAALLRLLPPRRISRLSAFLFLAAAATLYGGGKTNVLQRISRPMLAVLRQIATPWLAANWNIRGAWERSAPFDFRDGWVFPWGTNHLASVEILSRGEIWSSPFDPRPVASVGERLAIVPGVSSFYAAATDTGSYVFTWTDAAVERDTNRLMTASIELFRNGDIAVTTNGVALYSERVLPFAHSGFGQDEEWVAANFTNAAEIAAAGGYSAWVDEQVGDGLTNGLYRLTATIAADPPETMNIAVGGYSVAITNAGEYAFLLEKGPAYDIEVFPPSRDVSFAATDDVPARTTQHGRRAELRGSGESVREWTPAGGEAWTDYEPGAARARFFWLPWLCGSPSVPAHVFPGDTPITLEATLYDCTEGLVSLHWSASPGFSLSSPDSQTTELTLVDAPSWKQGEISITAAFSNNSLTSRLGGFTYGENDTPQTRCSITVPSALLVGYECMEGSGTASAQVDFSSDIAIAGTLRIWATGGGEKIQFSPSLPLEYEIGADGSFTRSFTVEGMSQSSAPHDVRLACAFSSYSGTVNARAYASTTVVSPKLVSVPSAPGTGLCVLKGSQVPVVLTVEPAAAGAEIRWQTAKRKTKDQYAPWTTRAVGSPSEALVMDEAGVFALRALTVCGGGCQSNAVEYVHATGEPFVDAISELRGPNKAGDRNHIGVAATQGLLDIRNAALAHLGNVEYTSASTLSALNGFSSVPSGRYKCNRFVADIAFEAGLSVPAIHVVPHFGPLPDGRYPPLANEWANGDVPIAGWTYLGRDVYPEPGFIAGHPAQTTGHCGIVDYDGWTISARLDGIGRKSESMLDGTCGYNKPKEDNNNAQ